MAEKKRQKLGAAKRKKVFLKTAGFCHVCGGQLDEDDWAADHVRPLAKGGPNTVDNYLPVCSVCNGVRWNRKPENIRTILRLGIIARKLIRSSIKQRSELGMALLKSKDASEKLPEMRDDPDLKVRAAVRKALKESSKTTRRK